MSPMVKQGPIEFNLMVGFGLSLSLNFFIEQRHTIAATVIIQLVADVLRMRPIDYLKYVKKN
jgi:hypothetical protein